MLPLLKQSPLPSPAVLPAWFSGLSSLMSHYSRVRSQHPKPQHLKTRYLVMWFTSYRLKMPLWVKGNLSSTLKHLLGQYNENYIYTYIYKTYNEKITRHDLSKQTWSKTSCLISNQNCSLQLWVYMFCCTLEILQCPVPQYMLGMLEREVRIQYLIQDAVNLKVL